MGKGLLFNELVGQRIYGGDLYTQITDVEKLLGRFNSHTVDKLFINVDEATFGGYTSQACKLKGMVTESTVSYEAKGKDAVTIPSRLNLVFTSNDTFPVKIESDDRRYFVLATENSQANDHGVFGRLAPLMRDRSNDTAELFYRWLMSRDLTGFNPRAFPRTKAREEMAAEAREQIHVWLQDVCELPHNLYNTERASAQTVLSADCYRAYELWHQRDGGRLEKLTRDKFSKKLMRFLGKQAHGSTGKARTYTFPHWEDLAEMLKAKSVWSDAY